ncbi:hypothetical protein P154DRAFT_562217 [Amniculicola lignicola CBS 123094]|uniref:Uncharacterized protein n=1 Tax=Amniculicola lignicola CBS 123094 TaxID=1392246 RepID=A0A6A5WPJ0_9PLEO|nr:hypothetical protein P154DRAFT_562217 [Amniculicola lignicola CBS 123094]
MTSSSLEANLLPTTSLRSTSFFEHLHFDVRALIYDCMDLPPISHDYVGFILASRQAKKEAHEAVTRALRQYMNGFKRRYELFEKHSIAISGITPNNSFTQLCEIAIQGPLIMFDNANFYVHRFERYLFPKPFRKITLICSGEQYHPLDAGKERIVQLESFATRMTNTMKNFIDQINVRDIKTKSIILAWDLRGGEGGPAVPIQMRGKRYQRLIQDEQVTCYHLQSNGADVGEFGLLSEGKWEEEVDLEDFLFAEHCSSEGIGEKLESGLKGMDEDVYEEGRLFASDLFASVIGHSLNDWEYESE